MEAPIRLTQAEQDLGDVQDSAILERTPPAVSNDGAGRDDEAISAAERRVDREKARIEQRQKLIAAGLVSSSDLGSLEEELGRRELDLYWVQSRAEHAAQAAASAKSKISVSAALETRQLEDARFRDESQLLASEDFAPNGMLHYAGDGGFDETLDLKPLSAAFEAEFNRALPISADGETEVHRAMGFDHRGRIDVAVNPRDPDGVWLRHYLQARKIPYYAFLSAIPGKATAAHVHIGPGSTRIPRAD